MFVRWPHQVKNLDDFMAISGNYIDASNLDLALVELTHQARATGEVRTDADSVQMKRLLCRLG